MTMYLFSHYIQIMLLPPGLNLFIIILGGILWCCWRTAGKIIITIGIVSLWLLSAPIIAYKMIDILQNQYPLLQIDQLNTSISHHAIVVLGGGEAVQAEYGNKNTVSDFTRHRVDYAAYLYQKTHLPIIVSGGKSNEEGQSEAELMSNILKNNFNIKTIIKEDKSFNTADESRLIAPIVKQHHIDAVYLVTHAWHMPRSVFAFQCAGITVIPAPMGQYVYEPNYALINFLPNIDALHTSSIAIHEFIGLLWYHVKDWKWQC
jgi:uncharacterized SAM-binding protein YcdF (DUF218 family)